MRNVFFIVIICVIFSGCQTSRIFIHYDGYPAVEMSCNNLGDTELQLDYKDITITCYGGKLSEQAATLVTDMSSAIVSSILPTGAIGKIFSFFTGNEDGE